VHVIVVTPKLIDPIRDTRRDWMCELRPCVANISSCAYSISREDQYFLLKSGYCTNLIKMEATKLKPRPATVLLSLLLASGVIR